MYIPCIDNLMYLKHKTEIRMCIREPIMDSLEGSTCKKVDFSIFCVS